ncbi:MAG: PAS domain S-box protein [Terracidiphilus sp.]|jgi:PAS domain S-box-containing protein
MKSRRQIGIEDLLPAKAHLKLVDDRNLLEALMEHSTDRVYFKDMESRFIKISRAQAELLNLDASGDAVGKSDRDFFGSEHADKTLQDELKIIHSGEPLINMEEREEWPDGRITWSSSSKMPLFDTAGKCIGTFGISRDITPRKVAEDAYKHIFEEAAIGIIRFTPSGRLLKINKALSDMHGYSSPEEMLEATSNAEPLSLVDPIQLFELIQSVVADDKVHSAELAIYRKDRSKKWVRKNLRSIRDASGNVVYCEGTVEDITERKLAEQKLQESESKYRALFEESADAAWLMDGSRFFDCNSAALKMFGYTAGVIPNHPAEMSPPIQPDGMPSNEAANRRISLAFENGSERFEWLHKRADGSLFPADVHLTAVTLNSQPALLAIIRDITEQKRAEEGLSLKNALLEAQTEATIDGILAVDEADRVILANKQFGLNFGVPDDLLSAGDDRALREFVTHKIEDPRAFIEKVNYLNSHRSEKSVDEIRFKNGQIFERYSAPLVDSSERYRGRIWYFRDVTERKRTEDILRRLSSVVEQSPVSVIIADLQGDITYVNRMFTKTSGYEAGEVLGKNSRILRSGASSQAEYHNLWETITAGKEWRGIFHNRKKNGDLYWESAVIRALEDHDGTITHFLALKEDITEKLALEGQLRQSQKLEAIGQLAAGIAHEINTPIQYVGDNTNCFKDSWNLLSCLLAAAQKLRDEVPPQAVSESTIENFDRCSRNADVEFLSRDIPQAIDQTLEGVERISRIVRAMKEFSHPGSQEKRVVDLNKAIETTITISRSEWKYVARMETHLDPGLPPVPCLAAEINQVLLNLVVNSAHAIADVVPHDGDSMGTITVSTRLDGDWVEISVADSGTGIPENVRDRVFDPFFTTKEVGKGTGQGLMLAHTVVVKKHGGKIWFDSEVGKGTTFYVRLPLSLGAED